MNLHYVVNGVLAVALIVFCVVWWLETRRGNRLF